MIDPAVRLKNVVVQLGEGCVQTVDSTERLMPHLVGVRQAPEDYGVCGYTVPPFAPSRVLNQVDPTLAGRYLLVLVSIPLGYREGRFARRSR